MISKGRPAVLAALGALLLGCGGASVPHDSGGDSGDIYAWLLVNAKP